MMNIAKEKLVATWLVVRGDFETHEVPYQVLAKYRPLFKYVSAREIARLNLSDERILSFVGTHTELDRHQVGVVASRYIQMNPHWSEPHYLNLMNNLLCGVPMSFMRKIPEANYLQLSRQALGKSYSWAAQDVARLGLLLTEVDGHELAAVNPEAMSGITAQVMLEIPERNLMHITDMQLRFLGQQPLNILAKKMKIYHERLVKLSYAAGLHSECLLVIILTLSIQFAIK
ncbi:unnamed protein product [Diatraea saccharalis]|uniref:Uncharacterized protein n=1 Tax=Diatraea saccharalis TaxID=40085 RepID=A0A9N9N1Z8_9NEOP|nr:unnamed protein product [Diatraea saccharalis]